MTGYGTIVKDNFSLVKNTGFVCFLCAIEKWKVHIGQNVYLGPRNQSDAHFLLHSYYSTNKMYLGYSVLNLVIKSMNQLMFFLQYLIGRLIYPPILSTDVCL